MLNPFECAIAPPLTPPRVKNHRSHKLSSPPELKLPVFSPTTPSSCKKNSMKTPISTKKNSSASTTNSNSYLRTPNTSKKPQPTRQLHKSSSSKSLRTPNLPPTPEFTPYKNQTMKRSQQVEAISSSASNSYFAQTQNSRRSSKPNKQSGSNSKLHKLSPKLDSSDNETTSSSTNDFAFGMFLPTPSTTKKSNTSPTRNLTAPPAIDFSKLYSNEEEEDTSFQDDTNLSIGESIKVSDITCDTTRDSLSLPILKESFISPQKDTKSIQSDSIFLSPSTPGPQLIDEETINHWHGKSFNNEFSSDDELSDEDFFPTSITLENPFIQDSPPRFKSHSTPTIKVKNPFDSESSPILGKGQIDYSTHAEYINNKTGAVRIVKLLERQMKIKPKKLDFSSLA
ncbi:hypothetical protein HYPBUDRAFT_4127 [Hyphopichia burtonii NRRL Y-1933]|uniref:Uncharacterized protein n=1 Tax=Hyphopichia burtonii NRRL Y-1933 TaxID=984485 RepID=A0A1E4RSM9_9ASCO|nr:hypothetical protein HYPBUDRAFT_4127 [Hyphopichia burtonii NRRL Y-1933]ODV70238.1 hypothetical protein HYPBUDRAFT_4127 [Hyphopichia burtonii NRRL Y-1933]